MLNNESAPDSVQDRVELHLHTSVRHDAKQSYAPSNRSSEGGLLQSFAEIKSSQWLRVPIL